MSIESHRMYDQMPGTDIHPNFPEHKIDVPPLWVRERSKLPNLGEYACLSTHNETMFPKSVREVLVSYVKAWETKVLKYGSHLIVAGGATYQRRNWGASAVVNEIVMRFATRNAMTVDWMGVDLVRKMLDAKEKRDDLYGMLRNHLCTVNLLLIADPLRVTSREERSLIELVYTSRLNRKLPTITTLHPPVLDEGFGAVAERIGAYSAEILMDYNHGFIAQYPILTGL